MSGRRPSPFGGCDDFHRAAARPATTHGLTRREVVGLGLGASVALYLTPGTPVQRALEASRVAAQDGEARMLVSVFLPGGLDLLDTIVPLDQYGAYRSARPSIAQPESSARLGSTGLGVHAALRRGNRGGLHGLYGQGKLGLLPGIDYADPDLSHFTSRSFWETGLVTKDAATGWLGRWADRYGSGENPFQALGIGSRVSPVLRSGRAPVSAVETPRTAMLNPPVAAKAVPGVVEAYAALGLPGSKRPGRDAVNRAVRLTKRVSDEMAPYRDVAPEPTQAAGAAEGLATLLNSSPDDSAPAYPPTRMGDRLRTLAFLLAQPLGVRVAALDGVGGFDTHDGQPVALDRLLTDVSQSLSAFQLDLEQRGLADRVLVLVWSEFGRRLKANGSQGTDHGAGGLAWVQGTQARAGVLTEYPRLDALDRHGNLRVTVDFRQVYASLLEQWLGADATAVIPRAGEMARVGLVR